MYTVWVSGGVAHFTSFTVNAPNEFIAQIRAKVAARAMWRIRDVKIVSYVKIAEVATNGV